MANQAAEDLTAIPGEVKEPKKTREQQKEENTKRYDEVKQSESALVTQETQEAIEGQVVMGRPTMYSPELASELCALLAMGLSIRSACKGANMPSVATVYNWLARYPEFVEQYTRAKSDAADAMAEDIMDIADDSSNDYMEMTYNDQTITRLNQENIQRSKLRIETRRWLMSKYKPKKYGDKLDLTTGGEQLPTPLLGSLTRSAPEIREENTNDDINYVAD